MAQPVYSTRFLSVETHGANHIYTVPAGFVAVLRDVDACSPSASAAAAWNIVNSTTGAVIFFGSISSALLNQQWRGRQIFQAGEGIEVSAGGAQPFYISASGYLLTLP